MSRSKKKETQEVRIVCTGEVMRAPDEIIPYEREARIHSEEQVEKLRESLREYGFVRPLLVDEENRLVYGLGVLKAAIAEGMAQVPCNVARGLTEAQRRGYTLADDRLAELSNWDRQVVALELNYLAAQGLDVALIGFGPEDLAVPCLEDGPGLGPEPQEMAEGGFRYQEQYGVIVMCADEAQQQKVYEDLTSQGYECKVVAT